MRDTMEQFANRMRSLLNIDHYLLPELSDEDWREFQSNQFRYFINRAGLPQMRALWREIEKRQPENKEASK